LVNYLELLGRCFPDNQAYVLGTGDPTNYDDLIWLGASLPKATLDSSECYITNFDQTTGEEITSEVEVGNAGSGGAIFTLAFNVEATAKNVWLSHEGDNSLSSNKVPGIIPWNCKLVAVTFSNQTSNAGTDIQIHKSLAGAGNATSISHTWEIRGSRLGRKTVFAPDVTFAGGDKVGVYLKDQGKDVKYVTVVLYLQITDSVVNDFSESYSGDF